MNLHLYKVVDFCGIEQDSYTVIESTVVMTEKDLRNEFYRAMNNGWVPSNLIKDYMQDPDYQSEVWDTPEKSLKIGTIIAMLNDIGHYGGEHYYTIMETDVEVELNPVMVDRWLDVLNYWDDDVREAAERANDMRMYNEYDKVINDIYRMKKGV